MSPVGIGDVFLAPPLPVSTTGGPSVIISRSGTTKPARVGPVALYHLDPTVGVSADVSTPWGRTVTYGGLAARPAAEQLSELVNNQHAQVTIGPFTGVLVAVVRDECSALPEFDGIHLLTRCDVSATYLNMAAGRDGALSFTLTGVLLAASLAPVLIRSARTRPNAYGLDGRSTVTNPFESLAGDGFAQATGGLASVVREYNAALEGEAAVSASATVSLGSTLVTDSILPVVVPILDGPFTGELPEWATMHGGRPRGYDRRQMRQVYGYDHTFASTTDAQITNGLLTLWCGPRGMPAFVAVSAFVGGAERQVGCLSLSDTDDVLAVRIRQATADVVCMTITVRNAGDVTLSLRRASRYVAIEHGDLRPPAPFLARTVRWLGMPPARGITGVSATTSARYGHGVAVATGGQMGFAWPATQPVTRWAYGHSWTPGAASSSQPDSGFWSVWAGGVAVGIVWWDAASKRVKWTQGANTLSSPVLAFSAGSAVCWTVSFSTAGGMALTTSVDGATAVTVSDATMVDPGTTTRTFASHWIGYTTVGFGALGFGVGPFGGTTVTPDLGGAVSNAMLFDGPLTVAEANALAVSATRLGGIPSPWSRLVAFWPFEAVPVPLGSTLTSGRRFEATTDGGSTRAPDANGLTKGIAALTSASSATSGDGFGLSVTTKQLVAGAYLATSAAYDDLDDHHLELAAANRVSPSAR